MRSSYLILHTTAQKNAKSRDFENPDNYVLGHKRTPIYDTVTLLSS